MSKRRDSTIQVKRIYDAAREDDGTRVLVDRVWPRGLSKDKAQVEHWLKDLAPSTALRRWFSHDPAKWPEFQRRYLEELQANDSDSLEQLKQWAQDGTPVTLLFASRETEHNNAVALKTFLDQGQL